MIGGKHLDWVGTWSCLHCGQVFSTTNSQKQARVEMRKRLKLPRHKNGWIKVSRARNAHYSAASAFNWPSAPHRLDKNETRRK